MRIMVISHAREKEPKDVWMRWHRLPYLFKQKGHKIKYILKKDWKWFYLKYLKFKPDVIISAGVIGALPCFLKKIGLVRKPIIHDLTDNYTECMAAKHSIDKIAFLEHYIIKNSDFIISPSIAAIKKCKLFGKKAFYIPHGVNPDFDEKKPVKLKGKLKILYSGEQTKYKRVDELIKAVKDLDCDLYLLGTTNEEFKKFASKNVHFLGQVHHNNVASYLKAADILVITNNDDSTLKMFEYLKAGKVILGLKGRLEYFLSNKVNAYLTYDLAKGIKELTSNKKLREYLIKNAKKINVKVWDEIAEDYLELIKKLIRND